MSTWISRAGLVLLVAACVPVADGAIGLASKGAVPVLGGAVTVAGPRGYCIDPAASREAGETAVMVLGRCSGRGAADPALITVAVGAPGSADVLAIGPAALAAFFTSPNGRSALARDGQSASVAIHAVTMADGVLVMDLTDVAIGRYWRALIGVRGRLVTVSVSAPAGEGLQQETGRRLLDGTAAAMRSANRDTAG